MELNGRMMTLVRKDIRDLLRDWRLSFPAIFLTLIFPAILTVGVYYFANFLEPGNPAGPMSKLFPLSVFVVTFFPVGLTVVVPLESFVGERERTTMETLLTTPLTDREIYLGKFLSSIIIPLLLSFATFLIYTLTSWIFLDQTLPFKTSLLFLSLVMAKTLALFSGAVLISSQSKTVRAANLTSTLIVMPFTLLIAIESYCVMREIHYVLEFLLPFLMIYFFLFLSAGLSLFDRESFLFFDTASDSIVSLFKKLMRRKSGGLSPYGRLLEALKGEKRNFYLLLAFFAAGIIAGFAFSFRFDAWRAAHHIQSSEAAKKVVQMLQDKNVLPELQFSSVFIHNLTAVFITGLLSVFTFGAFAFISMLLNGAILGFLAGMSFISSFSDMLKLAAALLPHGIIEFTALFIALIFALRLGHFMFRRRRKAGLFENFLEEFGMFLRSFYLTGPLFLAAALIETNFYKWFQ